MIEVLWHGRGGQGAFTAARLLGAAACFKDGQFALAFPSFGPERRGAPMRAFTKISSAAIGDRTAVVRADYVVYLDGTLLPDSWADELKPGGLCLVNTTEAFDDPRLIAIDADGMSSAVLGRAIPNTVFLGVLAALVSAKGEEVDESLVEQAIYALMPAKLHEKNIALVKQASAQVSARVPESASFESEASKSAEAPSGASLTHGIEISPLRRAHSSASHIPQLYTGMPDVAEYAACTCFKAGFLTQTNAGWRNVRPVVDDAKCTGCLQCYMVCPDGAIYKKPVQNKTRLGVSIDLDFCKGCGVCANACKFNALEMTSEQEALAVEGEVNA